MDGEPGRDDLEALLRLQEAETAVRRLERRLDELPEQAALDTSLERSASLKATQDAQRVDLSQLDAGVRRFEGELELLQERRGTEQQRMYAGEISNPRELQAIRAELENLAARIATVEDRLLEAMERREEVRETVDGLEDERLRLLEEQEQLTAARDAAAKELLADLAEAQVARDRERERLPGSLIARYDTAKQRAAGVGVGALHQGICTACRLELTPLEISDLRAGPPLGTCPQCQRLLVVPE